MSISAGVCKKAEDAYPTGTPGPCSQFLVESELILLVLCMYYFSYFMFFVVFGCFPCLVFVHGLPYFDFGKNLGSLDYSYRQREK